MSHPARHLFPITLSVVVAAAMFSACAPAEGEVGADGDSDSSELVSAPEEVGATTQQISGSLTVGATLIATTDVNLRSGPSTDDAVLHVVPNGASVTVESATASGGFYKVKHNGTVGWSYGTYYKAAGTSTSSAREDAIARAKSGVGFSYWWGHGRYLASGPSSSNKGSCSGSCPSCSHSGSYGGDCSGYIGKIWKVTGSGADISVDAHPYSTGSFVSDTSQWSTISRGSVQPADAMVYNSGGEGHIFLYSSGDGWGSMYAYECKGCSSGCVYNLRTASSAYKAIKRTGY